MAWFLDDEPTNTGETNLGETESNDQKSGIICPNKLIMMFFIGAAVGVLLAIGVLFMRNQMSEDNENEESDKEHSDEDVEEPVEESFRPYRYSRRRF